MYNIGPNKRFKLLVTSDETPEESHEPEDVIMFLAGKQNINGSWNLDESVLVKIGLDLSKLKNTKPGHYWITKIVINNRFLNFLLFCLEKIYQLLLKTPELGIRF